jgi:diguanylate cyclase (GGDEF)-like protein
MNQTVTDKFAADILIVDDRPNNLKLLSKILTSYNYKVRCAVNGQVALQTVKTKIPDLILLDITMPEMDGYQVCLELKKNPQISQIPVIFISALDATFDKVKAFQVGGIDYITKPFEIAEVIARIKNQLQLKKTQEELHFLNHQLETLNNQLEQKVNERTVQLQAEIIQRCQAQDRLMHMAMHDPLTNLANRTYLLQRLQTCVDIVRNSPTEKFVLLFLGCDRFKLVNDSLGYLAGDRLLIAIADRLQNLLPQDSLLARSGGDEFIIVLDSMNSVEKAIELVQHLQKKFTQSTVFGQREIFINFSVGIVLGTEDYETPEQVLRDADIAMHQAKQCGIATYKVFNAEMHQKALATLQLETDLQLAVNKEEFVLHYQPIVCLKNNQITGAEALIRWFHSQQGLISPYKFIPIAEETNLIIPLGMWIVKQACLQIAHWQKQIQNHTLKNLEVEVNLSIIQLAQPNLVEQIEEIIQETKIARRGLKLEITESIFMERVQTSQPTLERLKARGLELILDDFGTGYSSLEYLQKLPISTLKIDRSFIQNLENTDHNQKIVEATINLAHTLGLDVVAEGIETLEQLKILKHLGCDYGQGYLFSKPIEANALEEFILQFDSQAFN